MSERDPLEGEPDAVLLQYLESVVGPLRGRTRIAPDSHDDPVYLMHVVDELGRRSVREAAWPITELLPWPYLDEFGVHVEPRCFSALREIGDDRIIAPLLARTGADVLLDSTEQSLAGLAGGLNEDSSQHAWYAEPGLDHLSNVLTIALEKGLTHGEAAKLWADEAIAKMPDVPPDWLCDLSLYGTMKSDSVQDGEASGPPFVILALSVIYYYSVGNITLGRALEALSGGLGGIRQKTLSFVIHTDAFQDNEIVRETRRKLEERFTRILNAEPWLRSAVEELSA